MTALLPEKDRYRGHGKNHCSDAEESCLSFYRQRDNNADRGESVHDDPYPRARQNFRPLYRKIAPAVEGHRHPEKKRARHRDDPYSNKRVNVGVALEQRHHEKESQGEE